MKTKGTNMKIGGQPATQPYISKENSKALKKLKIEFDVKSINEVITKLLHEYGKVFKHQ
jgi:hypothetical protein